MGNKVKIGDSNKINDTIVAGGNVEIKKEDSNQESFLKLVGKHLEAIISAAISGAVSAIVAALITYFIMK